MILRVLKTFVPITVRPRIRPQDSRAFCVLILSFAVQVSNQRYCMGLLQRSGFSSFPM
jgi:hypothetical protein